MSKIFHAVLPWLSDVTFLFLFFGCLTAIYWLHRYLVLIKSYKDIPQFKFLPIYSYVSVILKVFRKKHPRTAILEFVSCIGKIYGQGGITLLWLGLRPVALFFKPDKIKELVNNSAVLEKSVEYDFLKPWLGTGLLTSSGNKWRSHRKLLTPSFHFRILENFLPAFNEQSAILLKKLESVVGKPWVDISPFITMFTLDTICQTAMGVRLKTQSGCCHDYLEAIEQISDIFFYRIARPWLWFDPIFLYLFPSGRRFWKNMKCIHDFTRKVIKEKKELLIKEITEGTYEENDPLKKKAFLELLLKYHLKNDTVITEEDIREEVDTFLLGGYDTTATSLCFTLYEIGRYPEIQQKLYQELATIFGCDTERDITMEDVKQMKYLECIIKESLRLYPPLPMIGRRIKKDLKIGNYTLKPGCSCIVPIYAVHMDPEQFPVPEKFDPDRFLPENSKRHPYAFIPFSAGPRNCIGQKFGLMELKIVLAHIFRKLKITSVDPRDKIHLMAGIVLKNEEPIRIRFELRVTKDL